MLSKEFWGFFFLESYCEHSFMSVNIFMHNLTAEKIISRTTHVLNTLHPFLN